MKELIKRRQELECALIELKNDLDSEDKASKVQSKVSDLFTDLEDKLCKIVEEKDVLSKIELDDCLSSIENVFDFVVVYAEFMNVWNKRKGLTYHYSSNVLSTAESVLNCYKKERAEHYKVLFEKNQFPTRGFEKKLSLQNRSKDIICIVIGGILLVATTVMSFYLDVKTSFQYLQFRVMLALSVSLLAAGLLKGFLETKTEVKIKFSRVQITAFGTIGLFLILYFCNPAAPPDISETTNQTTSLLR